MASRLLGRLVGMFPGRGDSTLWRLEGRSLEWICWATASLPVVGAERPAVWLDDGSGYRMLVAGYVLPILSISSKFLGVRCG
jgi:hypothetical protein